MTLPMTLKTCCTLFLFLLTALLVPPASYAQIAPTIEPHLVGSDSCRSCHQKEFDGWKKTRMANVIRDPRQHPEAVLGDFNTPDPVRTFTLDQVAFVYGSR